jgi:hypothetical protein
MNALLLIGRISPQWHNIQGLLYSLLKLQYLLLLLIHLLLKFVDNVLL